MVVMGRRRYNVKHLTQILKSLAELDYDNDMVFDRMSQHIMDKLDKADPKALCDLVSLPTLKPRFTPLPGYHLDLPVC